MYPRKENSPQRNGVWNGDRVLLFLLFSANRYYWNTIENKTIKRKCPANKEDGEGWRELW